MRVSISTDFLSPFSSVSPAVKPTVIDVDIYVNSIGPVSSINMVSQTFLHQSTGNCMYMWVYEECTVHRLKGESVSAAAADSNFWMSATELIQNSLPVCGQIKIF